MNWKQEIKVKTGDLEYPLSGVPLDRTNCTTLHTNQRLLVEELMRRGVKVDLLIREIELLEARLGNHVEFIHDRDASIPSNAAVYIAGDKYLVKKLLSRAGLSVARGERFYPTQIKDALTYSAGFNMPLVLKPVLGSHGEGLDPDLNSVEEVEQAIHRFLLANGKDTPFMLEEQFSGEEYRVFITLKGGYAVLKRTPAAVRGDGIQTVAGLVASENNRRSQAGISSLCPITLDFQVEKLLSRTGKALQSIPAKDEYLPLRRNSNVAMGGICEDVTETVHPSLVEVAAEALKTIHGLPYAGVDILTTCATDIQTPDRYRVLEINTNPGLKMHAFPAAGKGRNVAGMIADFIFPETVQK